MKVRFPFSINKKTEMDQLLINYTAQSNTIGCRGISFKGVITAITEQPLK